MKHLIAASCVMGILAPAAAGWPESSAVDWNGVPPGTYLSADHTEAVIAKGEPALFFSVVILGTSGMGERRVEVKLHCSLHPDGEIICPVPSGDADARDLIWYRWDYDTGHITRTHPVSGKTVTYERALD